MVLELDPATLKQNPLQTDLPDIHMSYDALPEDLAKSKPASPDTRSKQQEVINSLPHSDRRSFENAQRGFIDTLDPLKI